MIEAVLFDGDQTLWDFQRVMREALDRVADELRSARPGPFTQALRWHDLERDRADVGVEYEAREYNLHRLRVLGFARTLGRCRAADGGAQTDERGQTDEPDEADEAALARQLADSYFEHRDRDPALFADTLPCLESLREHYRLGLLSNGSRLPEKVGLGAYFEAVVFAQDHGVAKPEPGLFAVAERALGVGPAACVLVGDHPLYDVAGAKRAGWRAVWLDRTGDGSFARHEDVGELPDAVVRSLDELPEALRRL
jgi:FMN hydrolase / 5-amino-6-(5-phospho-D-ribitylamino)uracil phosphatase